MRQRRTSFELVHVCAHFARSGQRQTMDQHLVAYLGQKFGLWPMVRDWRRAVIAALTSYEQADPAVAAFGKVLR